MPLVEAYRILRLEPDASRIDAERSYREIREVYAPGNLATYALFEDGQRKEKLKQAEEAFLALQQYFADSQREASLPGAKEAEAVVEKLPAGERTPGEEVRSWRERRGLSVSEVGTRTKISPMTLESIEKQTYDRLPAPVYLRGFLNQYLKLLAVPDPDDLVERYLDGYVRKQGSS
jgi:flagellar biosynthesis protein FlhG